MRVLFAVLLAAMLLRPTSAEAQIGAPSVRETAEAMSFCLTERVQDRIIGRSWVEPQPDGYRVAMSMRYPPPWTEDVYAWVDLVMTDVSALPPGSADAYGEQRGGRGYLAQHGGYRDADLVNQGHRCLLWGLGLPVA